MSEYLEERNEQGFTLIELLIAIVVVGILAAVAIVGIGGLTNTGSKSACKSTQDSVKAASAAFYANQEPNAWPTSFGQMTTKSTTAPVNDPPVLELSPGVSGTGSVLTGNGWTLTGAFSAGDSPNFVGTGLGCVTT